MGLKILHSADWHLDSPFASFSETQRSELQAVQRRLPRQIADVCRRECCDLVLLAGDIFDGNPRRETVERLKQALADCAVPVFIAPGNHDFCAPGSPWLEEVWPENVHIFRGTPESISLPELRCRVYGAGYQSMDCPPLLEGFRADGQEQCRIAVVHGDPTSPQSPYCPVTAAQARDSGLDYLALGHIHKAGAFRAGSTLCAWPGSPMGRGWDETGEKGVCIVTLGNTTELQATPLDTLCFYEKTLDIGAQTPEAVLPADASRDFYRVTLRGTGKADIPALLARFSHLPNLEFRDETEAPADLWDYTAEDSLRGAYFRLLKEAAEGTDADTALLAAEISHRLLEGKEVILP